jgi:hypothetical protein
MRVPREQLRRLFRKVAFWRQNPKMGSRKINDLGASTFLFSVICDRAHEKAAKGPTSLQAMSSAPERK